jgi:sugar phosphate isomerase/epimerase
MSKPVVAAQLYTLRELLKTPSDIAGALKRVRQIGYTAVQLSGLGEIEPRELAMILQGEGLTCCGTHVSFGRMKDQPQAVIEEHKLWGCRYPAIGGFGYQAAPARDVWEQFAADYSQVAAKFAAAGLKIGYHNHSHELMHVDGTSPLQILIDKCSKDVWFEIDTYWITHGGGDPCQWIRKVSGRIPCVHFKDMTITAERQQHMAEVGEGNLNWPGIIEASSAAGAEWFIVEQDDCYGKDPFDCLATSLRNLKAMGYE